MVIKEIAVNEENYKEWLKAQKKEDGKISRLEFIASLGDKDAIECLSRFRNGEISYDNIDVRKVNKKEDKENYEFANVNDKNIKGMKMFYKGLCLMYDCEDEADKIYNIKSQVFLKAIYGALLMENMDEIKSCIKTICGLVKVATKYEKEGKEND